MSRNRHNSETSFIYLLRDPITKEVGYVGVTYDPRDRYRSHVFANIDRLRKSRHPKDVWIVALADRAMVPVMQILDEVPNHGREMAEQRWQVKIYKTEKTIPDFLRACVGRWLPTGISSAS